MSDNSTQTIIEKAEKWDKAYSFVYDDEMPFTPERIALVMNFVNDHFPDFDTKKEFEDMITEYTDWETELIEAEDTIKIIKELAETALSKYVSIQGAYNTRTTALELILGVINDSSTSKTTTKSDTLRIHGGKVEELDPELQSILKHRKRIK